MNKNIKENPREEKLWTGIVGKLVSVRTDFQMTNLDWGFLIDWITIILTGP